VVLGAGEIVVVVVVALITSRLSVVWVGGCGNGKMGAACHTPVIPRRHWWCQFVYPANPGLSLHQGSSQRSMLPDW